MGPELLRQCSYATRTHMKHPSQSSLPDQSASEPMPDTLGGVEHRQIVYRVLFDRPAIARRLAAVAGACRFVWNEMLDQQAQLHDMARMRGAKPLAPTFFTLVKASTQLRRVTPWLQAMPYAPVRYTLSPRRSSARAAPAPRAWPARSPKRSAARRRQCPRRRRIAGIRQRPGSPPGRAGSRPAQ